MGFLLTLSRSLSAVHSQPFTLSRLGQDLSRPATAQFFAQSKDIDPRDKPGGDGGASRYLMACGLIGEPVPPVMMSGGPQKKNS
jgi:hypothetical protein